MGDANRVPLSALGEIFDGPHATPRRCEEGPYFLNISSLNCGRLNLAESDHVSEEDFVKWTRRVTPAEGDLLFSYETRLGEAALMPAGVRACLGRRMALLRPDRSVVDPRFLLYYYLSPEFQRIIEKNMIHGATVTRIGIATMPEWEVNVPNIPKQRAIADVLGALDDKIAANNAAAAKALELARLAYNVRVDGSARKPMSAVLEPTLGGTPKRTDESMWGGPVAWASAKDIAGAPHGVVTSTSETISELAASKTRTREMPAETVVLTARGTVGVVARLGLPSAINQSCYGFEPSAIPASSLFFTIENAAAQARSMAHGSVFDTITMNTFNHVQIPAFSESEWGSIEQSIEPLLRISQQKVVESGSLATTRDELLPLLMSGKVRVRDAEKVVEEVV